jgi:ribose 5-phosphate isomerase A
VATRRTEPACATIAPTRSLEVRDPARAGAVLTDDLRPPEDFHPTERRSMQRSPPINQIPGVVAVGLFARRAADVVIVGGEPARVL